MIFVKNKYVKPYWSCGDVGLRIWFLRENRSLTKKNKK